MDSQGPGRKLGLFVSVEANCVRPRPQQGAAAQANVAEALGQRLGLPEFLEGN